MKIGIMQPYFFPYLGYFQLIYAVNKMVIYDNIQYTKKGWFNRNRYLLNNEDRFFTIPIEKDSDFLDVYERKVSQNFNKEKIKNQINIAYRKAPFYDEIFPIFCDCIDFEDYNLFNYIFNSIKQITNYLEIDTEIIISSSLNINHNLKGEEKVLAICKEIGADEYINPIGGQNLYCKERFHQNNIILKFIMMNPNITYLQFGKEFIPALSILDTLMFNSPQSVKEMLRNYQLK
ncbi:MAG: WbqC family protein [Lachnospiraceae bacterium]|nr:WbqC family protein [Lachnospiraceae bacterium]